MPIQLPANANIAQSQPCKLPEEIPAKNAPILHPNANLAPTPISKPPIIAAISWREGGHGCCAKLAVMAASNPAPIIIPKFIRLLISANTDCFRARAGPGHCQNTALSIGRPANKASLPPQTVNPNVTPQGWPEITNTKAQRTAINPVPKSHFLLSARPVLCAR